jgi:hypothetical protein
MRTKTIIIIEKEGDLIDATYCNDPDYELGSKAHVDETVIVQPETMEECGCCGGYHRPEFHGDCREDNERFWPVD